MENGELLNQSVKSFFADWKSCLFFFLYPEGEVLHKAVELLSVSLNFLSKLEVIFKVLQYFFVFQQLEAHVVNSLLVSRQTNVKGVLLKLKHTPRVKVIAPPSFSFVQTSSV